jgi:hypothetical protein
VITDKLNGQNVVRLGLFANEDKFPGVNEEMTHRGRVVDVSGTHCEERTLPFPVP